MALDQVHQKGPKSTGSLTHFIPLILGKVSVIPDWQSQTSVGGSLHLSDTTQTRGCAGYCYSSKVGLRKINWPEARSVTFHSLGPISLKVQVLNHRRLDRSSVELCRKWQLLKHLQRKVSAILSTFSSRRWSDATRISFQACFTETQVNFP